MDDKDHHHVVESSHKLSHYSLNDRWCQLLLLQLHYLLQVTSIAVFHKYIVPGVRFNGFPHADNILGLDCILVGNLTDHQLLLRVVKVLALHYLAGEQLWVSFQLDGCWNRRVGSPSRSGIGWSISGFTPGLLLELLHVWDLLREVDFAVLALTKYPLHVNQELADFLHLLDLCVLVVGWSPWRAMRLLQHASIHA